MKETLQQYRERTGFMRNSFAEYGDLRTSDGLMMKVDPAGRFKPFYGDTVIFTLPQPMIHWLEGIQNELYTACGECLAERIAPETFHITLHDLLNQAEYMPDGVARNRQEAMLVIEEARGLYPYPIAIRNNCLFSMVSTSIVMGFEPATEYDCTILMTMYERLQQIIPLSYPLTLHVTLAYYKPGEYDDDMLFKLRDAVRHVGREQRKWHLDIKDLYYATFESMAQYHLVAYNDPWKLSRFVQEQAEQYACALLEIQNGRKQSHWMWYIFPQLRGLGHSSMSFTYRIENLEEARAYLAHPILGKRLLEITRALLALHENDPGKVMGYPDDRKLRSCMTLFSQVEGADPAFEAVIAKYYGGRRDERTLILLNKGAVKE